MKKVEEAPKGLEQRDLFIDSDKAGNKWKFPAC
jgi:hypothetical protein